MAYKIRTLFLILLVSSLFLGGCASQMKTGESPSAGFIRQGYVLLDRADYRAASKMFRKGVGFDPQNARAYRGLGLAYLGLEDYYRAEVFMRKALQLDKSMSDLWGYLGDIYIRKGDEKSAMEFFDRCPPEDSHYAELHFRLGKMRLDNGNTDIASAEFKKSLTHSEFWGGYWGMGKLAELDSDWNSALNWYRQAGQKIDNAQVNLGLADAYYQLEHYIPAFFYYTLYLGKAGDKPEKYARKIKSNLEKLISLESDADEHKLKFALDKSEIVKAGVFEKNGKIVKVLFEGMLSRGKYDLKWNGQDQQGNPVNNGEYIGFVKSGDEVLLIKFLIQ
ncbi:tetratricopeptide repeat protein [bacterium]|nr:tetratricopeptide repeat protein [bacterium]